MIENPINLEGIQKMLNEEIKKLKPDTQFFLRNMLKKAANGTLKEELNLNNIQEFAKKIIDLESK